MIVDNTARFDQSYTVLDLSSFSNLKVLEVGDYSFTYVDYVKLIGLRQLESVVIGQNCFTTHKNDSPCLCHPRRCFYVMDCERLRELKMGRYSFSDYDVCEIENVDRLEVIEMGELKKESRNFYWSSLELKSDSQKNEMRIRPAQLEIASLR